jgi:hypothetical protein
LKKAFVGGGDRGFMVRDGHELKWAKQHIPIEVYVDSKASLWLDLVRDTVEDINGSVGFRLLNLAIVTIPDIVEIFTTSRRGYYQGGLLVTTGAQPGKAHADLNYDKRTGQIRNVLVQVPHGDPGKFPPEALLHDFIHGCGLDHDDVRESVMREKIVAGEHVVLLPADVKRLQIYRK